MIHLQAEGNRAYACGVERNHWDSMVISGRRNALGINCGNCVRTRLYAEAIKALEIRIGGIAPGG
jgi:hypothetical protein